MRIFGIALVLATVVATPARAAERAVKTPSGQPEMVFPNALASDVGAKLASACMDLGWQISNQSTNAVTCEVPMGVWQSAMTQMLIGNSYSTTPKGYVGVNIVQLGSNVRAQGRAWVETQMAFGQMRQHQYTDDKTFDNLLGLLGRAGGELPPGTTFTTNYIGFDNEPSSAQTSGLLVMKVYPTSPGDVAGLLVGDQIVKVDGKGFKDQGDFLKKLSRVKTESYPLGVRRNGQEVTLSIRRQTRPPVGSPQWNVLMGKDTTAVTAPVAVAR